jgi:hypothetical protein
VRRTGGIGSGTVVAHNRQPRPGPARLGIAYRHSHGLEHLWIPKWTSTVTMTPRSVRSQSLRRALRIVCPYSRPFLALNSIAMQAEANRLKQVIMRAWNYRALNFG